MLVRNHDKLASTCRKNGRVNFHLRNRQDSMFRKIAVAYNDSPEAERAVTLRHSALPKSWVDESGTKQAITVAAELPAYTAFAGAAGPSLSRVLANDREKFYEALAENARTSANHTVRRSKVTS